MSLFKVFDPAGGGAIRLLFSGTSREVYMIDQHPELLDRSSRQREPPVSNDLFLASVNVSDVRSWTKFRAACNYAPMKVTFIL
ncbi:hypothetical protein C5167_007714 [Papaver somniferum]|nr:hypothetical protein C5167_007714 [Papaver somniferum]